MKPLVPALAALALSACVATTHATKPSHLGVVRRTADLLAVVDQPGPLELETVNSTDWAVPLSGLVNLDAPAAKAAHLEDRDEPIQVYFHAIRHPTEGLYLVDTGVEKALRDDPEHAAVRGIMAKYMHREKMQFHAPLGDWLAQRPEPLKGVMLTHAHFDHVAGMPDVPKGTPIYAGPGETTPRALENIVVQANMDRELEGQAPIEEWQYAKDADGRFSGVIDVFGDGSLWALWTPGHTPGSTAYLARTTHGPVLMTGDTSHTVWGWEHAVEPGDFTADHEANRKSLAALELLVKEHPAIQVRLGHQQPAGAK